MFFIIIIIMLTVPFYNIHKSSLLSLVIACMPSIIIEVPSSMFVDEVLFILFIKNIQSLSTRLLSWCLRAVETGR